MNDVAESDTTVAETYPIKVAWSDEDDCYVAIAPDLPGCSAVSNSSLRIIAETRDAIVAWMRATRAAGNPIPPPSKGKDFLRFTQRESKFQ
jgi:predicted RNase H-like HicB family nuclease